MSTVSEGLCASIRRYLATHPGAADSAAGIRQWWLPREQSHVSDAALRAVLDRLVRRGELERRRLPDGEDLYTATPSAAS